MAAKQPSKKTRKGFLQQHGLSIAVMGILLMWLALYRQSDRDANGKAGQVVGNIVSEWTQILGLVVMTKYVGEIGSKEGG
jgi:hypothetical protein